MKPVELIAQEHPEKTHLPGRSPKQAPAPQPLLAIQGEKLTQNALSTRNFEGKKKGNPWQEKQQYC